MMQFEPILEGYFLYAVILTLLLLCLAQCAYFFLKNIVRKVLKSFLFLLFTLSLMLYVLQPYWEAEIPEQTALLISKDQKKEDFTALAEEYDADKVFKAGEEIREVNKLILYGQEFSEEDLLAIPLVDMDWIPQPFVEGDFENLNWKGVLQYGQRQILMGKVPGATGSKLEVRLSEEILAAKQIDEDGKVEVIFPALVLGKNELGIYIADEKMGDMRFFVQEAEVLDLEVKVGFPNPEARIITDYLRKRGERAKLDVQVSRDSRIISDMDSEGKTILFIDPSQLNSLNVDDLGTVYSGLFLFNLSNPAQDILNINKKLNTKFELNKTGEVSLESENGVSVLPYEFLLKSNQNSLFSSGFEITGDYVIGVSLLESSFELQLSGDSIGYAKIWEPILEQLSPKPKRFYSLSKPIFEGQLTALHLFDENLSLNDMGTNWKKDPVNDNVFTYQFTPKKEGWQELFGELSVYVESYDDFESIRQHQMILEYLKHRRGFANETEGLRKLEKFIPDWAWFLIVLATLTFVWVEPRFRN